MESLIASVSLSCSYSIRLSPQSPHPHCLHLNGLKAYSFNFGSHAPDLECPQNLSAIAWASKPPERRRLQSCNMTSPFTHDGNPHRLSEYMPTTVACRCQSLFWPERGMNRYIVTHPVSLWVGRLVQRSEGVAEAELHQLRRLPQAPLSLSLRQRQVQFIRHLSVLFLSRSRSHV